MRIIRPLVALVTGCLLSVSPVNPQAATTAAQAAGALQSATAALAGKSAVSDVTLNGTVEWIAGSDDETGTVTYKGVSGAYQIDMFFRSGDSQRNRFVCWRCPSRELDWVRRGDAQNFES